MSINTIQDILPLVEKPSRYLGTEINIVKKKACEIKLNIALAFPDLYEIGTSHFGLQILYDILNQSKDIAAERVFAPATDMEEYLKSYRLPLFSLETGKPLDQFDIIGFSLLYELNYTNILMMLDLAGIPFLSKERDLSHPFMIAGGPCTSNPEPIADFFDAIVIGDGEKVIQEMSAAWLNWKVEAGNEKIELLKSWSQIEGVYIPSFFEPVYEQASAGEHEFQSLQERYPEYRRIKRAIIPQLDREPFPEKPVLPYGKPVHDRLRLEIGRGCSRGCRFCQAGMIYRPVRERSMENLLEITQKSLAATGYDDISLLSLSTGDYGCLVPLMENLIGRYESRQVAVSLPSIRAGTLTPKLMNLIKEVRKTGFTIAPEAGTQRLRDVINKNLTEKEIFDTVTSAFELGWQVIKLYFMIGHPTETDRDLQGIVDLVKALRRIKGPKGRKAKINVSVTTFIPKAHTPFQWESQISLDESKAKLAWLKKELKLPGIQVKWQNPEVSLLEGIWARGDRRLSGLLIQAYRKGCKFDGWSDQFRFDLWQQAFAETGVDPFFYTGRQRGQNEPLPWDHIDTGVTSHFLKKEWQKAMKGELTSDCRQGNCSGCGVCDFKAIEPRIFSEPPSEAIHASQGADNRQVAYKKLKVSYSKQGQAKYFGHLEMVNIFLRAIRRAEIPVKFSGGFHPMPRISFGDPLPLGIASQNENFFLTVPDNIKPKTVISALNQQLPEGLRVHDCCLASSNRMQSNSGETSSPTVVYRITLKDGTFKADELEDFLQQSEIILTRTNQKGRVKKIDLKEVVLKIELLDSQRLQIILKNEIGKTVRPSEVLTIIFSLSEQRLRQADIVKLASAAENGQ